MRDSGIESQSETQGQGGHWGAVNHCRARRSLPPWRTFLVAIGATASLAGAQGAVAAGSECSNDTVRAVQSAAFLPDCRAFELVSPPDGEPNLRSFESPEHNSIGARASSVGSGIAWFSYYPLSGSLGGEFYNLSTRGSNDWTTEPVGPRLSARNSAYLYCSQKLFFSKDLSAGILTDGSHTAGVEQNSEEGECASNEPSLVPGEPEGFQNLLLRDSATGAFQLVDITPEKVTPGEAWLQGASDDFSHVVFEDNAKLTSSAPIGAGLYEWVAGTVSLITVLPSGTPTVGAFPSVVNDGSLFGTSPTTHSISADGTRVIFEAEGKLFLRENADQGLESARGPRGECLESGKACTVQLDASHAEGPGGGGGFLAADTTDTRIYFSDDAKAKLTAGTIEGSGEHLYEYDTQTGDLSDLAPAGGLGLQGLCGISDDGSYLYVVAGAALAAEATPGQPNLYLFHEGTVRFIATLAAEGGQVSHPEAAQESHDWTPTESTARVSPNGRYIGFSSIQRFTGYDNTPARPEDCIPIGGAPGAPCQEIFLYDAVENALHCVSCASNGSRPTGQGALPLAERSTDGSGPVYVQRNVLDDGRVFFDTTSPLLPSAANGVSNVYEYEGGHLSLISSGTSEANSFFYDASLSGGDVFFVTTQHLVQSDTANGMRLYDARVDGGFPESVPPPLCSGEGCRAAPAGAPGVPRLLTTDLQGFGNLLPTRNKVTPPTRRQKLERALRVCRRKANKRKRAACTRHARRRYAAGSSRGKHGAGK